MTNLVLQTATTTTLTKHDAERLQRGLRSWGETSGLAEPLPAGLADLLPSAIASAERRIAPIHEDALSVLMVTHLWDAGVPVPHEKNLARWYVLLAPYPEDVIADAFDETARTHRWAQPPRIADVIAKIEPEMNRRRAWKRKLENAAIRARMDAKSNIVSGEREPMTPETEAMIQEAKRALKDAVKPMPRVQGDSSREQPRREVGGGRPLSAVMRELAARPKADRPWVGEGQ